MPGGDRTGPYGAGSMTGRGAGFCAGYTVPGYVNPVGGRGFFGLGRGGGRGRGRGYRNMFWATGMPGWIRSYGAPAARPVGTNYDPFPGASISPEQEAEALKNQVQYMQGSIDALNERIRELETSSNKSGEKK